MTCDYIEDDPWYSYIGGNVQDKKDQEKDLKKKKHDRVGEAARETFPASDPPAYWASAPLKSAKKEDTEKEQDQ